MKTLTKEEEIEQLQQKKVALLDRYGLFGGGYYINLLHLQINKELEALGINPNS